MAESHSSGRPIILGEWNESGGRILGGILLIGSGVGLPLAMYLGWLPGANAFHIVAAIVTPVLCLVGVASLKIPLTVVINDKWVIRYIIWRKLLNRDRIAAIRFFDSAHDVTVLRQGTVNLKAHIFTQGILLELIDGKNICLEVSSQKMWAAQRTLIERCPELVVGAMLLECTCGARLPVYKTMAGTRIACKHCESPLEVPPLSQLIERSGGSTAQVDGG